MSASRPTVVLTIAGTDPLVGAGVFADVLTISECGAQPLAVVTAQVDQDSRGVRSWRAADLGAMTEAIRSALEDGRPDAIKVGMLGTADTLDAVASTLREGTRRGTWIVIDPVLASGGDAPMAAESLAEAIVPTVEALGRAGLNVVLTPNAPELGRLLKAPYPRTLSELSAHASALASAGGCAVLAKGGHLEDSVGTDVLASADGVEEFAPLHWPEDGDIHGTGCALSAAAAVRLAQGAALPAAIASARRVLAEKAMASRRIGTGRRQLGPLRSRN